MLNRALNVGEQLSKRRGMKIVSDCWDSLAAHDCQYGGYIFTGSEFSIYVNNWLFAPGDLVSIFSRFNEVGCVGHCVLRFLGVARVSLETRLISDPEMRCFGLSQSSLNFLEWAPVERCMIFRGR